MQWNIGWRRCSGGGDCGDVLVWEIIFYTSIDELASCVQARKQNMVHKYGQKSDWDLS
jgi:hypothetical protein